MISCSEKCSNCDVLLSIRCTVGASTYQLRLRLCVTLLLEWYAVAEWYGAGLAIARSRVRIPPMAAVYQRQLSVPSLRGRLMSTSGSW